MKIEFGDRLSESTLHAKVVKRLPIIEEMFGGFCTANAKVELGKDYRERDIVRLIVKDHGRTVRTAFAPDEFDNESHFRNRLHQFAGQVARLEGTNDCPNCGTKFYENPLPFKCTVCEFQMIQACPVCRHEVPISNYLTEGSTIWKCPECQSRVRVSYVEPMFDARGFLVQPLVELSIADSMTPTS